ncbi:MAG: hypothetical protein D4R58_00020 [Betaproteobacteria bacterium]|nr:MAG: hypothetical protein D4R58_00020 [Betaproteobacteria bacterium]
MLLLCILLSAFFIRGITGFGSALICGPLLILSHPLQFAVPRVLARDYDNYRAFYRSAQAKLPASD